VGFKVGQSFDLKDFPPDIRRAFERAAADGNAMVASVGKKAMGEGGKGWTYSTHGGAYGVDYTYRAAIAYGALGENLPQDAVYPSLSTDSEGKPLDGNSAYILHFDKGQLPPVKAFWSVTATNFSSIRMGLSTSTSRQTLPAQKKRRIGFRRPRRRLPC
jgi:hypothetical protein